MIQRDGRDHPGGRALPGPHRGPEPAGLPHRHDRERRAAPARPRPATSICEQVGYEPLLLARGPRPGRSSRRRDEPVSPGRRDRRRRSSSALGGVAAPAAAAVDRGAGERASWSDPGVSGRWLAGKVGAAVLTLLFVLIFNFFLFRVMGDPTTQLARLPQATPEEIDEAARRLRPRQAARRPVRRLHGRHAARSTSGSASARASRSGTRSRTRCRGRCCWSAPAPLLATLIGSLDGGDRRDQARNEDRRRACSASASSPTPRPSTGSGSS